MIPRQWHSKEPIVILSAFYRSSSLVECNPISPILVTWSQFAFREDFFLLHVFIYAKQNQSAYGIGKSRIRLSNWFWNLSLCPFTFQRHSFAFQQCFFYCLHVHILIKFFFIGSLLSPSGYTTQSCPYRRSWGRFFWSFCQLLNYSKRNTS